MNAYVAQGGPLHGQVLALASGSTLPMRVGAFHGRYERARQSGTPVHPALLRRVEKVGPCEECLAGADIGFTRWVEAQ